MSRRRSRRGTLGWLVTALAVVGALGVPPVSSAAPAAPDSKAAAADPNTLWYAKPAADWEQEALPIGNGAMGAMVVPQLPVRRSAWDGVEGCGRGGRHVI
ncbi:glycoside hydrolase N-terminal domain-containing protein [Streptomyces sp. 5-6(2022)]|uniref:glycoside hydrolase N-terminal domain-containing protein n=1 Tax=Streptomyces sp. 5-6(2022) TaxID=2936510 RepID=UPI0023B89A20|nr:glycoside hydrolase N-terminal domain-containing protein [Streptomyces sp. 5-6(2022)]